jgi:hypothetical protein
MWNVLLKKLNNFCQTISVADSAGSRWCVTANKNGGRKTSIIQLTKTPNYKHTN